MGSNLVHTFIAYFIFNIYIKTQFKSFEPFRNGRYKREILEDLRIYDINENNYNERLWFEIV